MKKKIAANDEKVQAQTLRPTKRNINAEKKGPHTAVREAKELNSVYCVSKSLTLAKSGSFNMLGFAGLGYPIMYPNVMEPSIKTEA